MDLEVEAKIEDVARILRFMKFNPVTVNNGILEAKLKKGLGRIHVWGTEVENGKTYLDVHWDALIHFIFIGVDYSKRPKEVCEEILNQAKKGGFKGRVVGGTNWFNRRNRAILKGIRVA